jgi:hypothetical protein
VRSRTSMSEPRMISPMSGTSARTRVPISPRWQAGLLGLQDVTRSSLHARHLDDRGPRTPSDG